MSPKKIWSKKLLCPKNLGETKILDQKIKALKKLGQISLVKIGSVKAEIFLIWTNFQQKKIDLKNCCVQKIWVKQNYGPKN